MIINYRKKYLLSDLIIGSLYLLVGVAGVIFQSGTYNLVLSIFFSLAGIFFLSSYFYKQKHQYLQIENNVLTCFLVGSKNRSIDLHQVTRIKKFTDEISFLTPHEKLKISTKLIAKEDLTAFIEVLASLDLEPEKNPFTETAEKSTI